MYEWAYEYIDRKIYEYIFVYRYMSTWIFLEMDICVCGYGYMA